MDENQRRADHRHAALGTRTGAITRNPEFYALGHASRFLAPGARRIVSDSVAGGLEPVAFRDPHGTLVLVAFNAAPRVTMLTVLSGERHFGYQLGPGAAATFRW